MKCVNMQINSLALKDTENLYLFLPSDKSKSSMQNPEIHFSRTLQSVSSLQGLSVPIGFNGSVSSGKNVTFILLGLQAKKKKSVQEIAKII